MIDLVPVLSREAVAVDCYVPEAMIDAHNVPMAIDPPAESVRTNQFIIQALAKARKRKPQLTGPTSKMRSFILCPLFLSKRLQAIASEKLAAEKAREEAEALKAQNVLTKEQKKAAIEERKLERAEAAKKRKKTAKKKKKKKKAEKVLREEAKAGKQALAAEAKATKQALVAEAKEAKVLKAKRTAEAKAVNKQKRAANGDPEFEDFASPPALKRARRGSNR